jgi:hypothetical protein
MKYILFLLLILSVLGYGESSTNYITEYGHKSYGIFVHYGWGGTEDSDYESCITSYADGSYPEDVDEVADNFDVEGFVDDIAEMSPEYLIFTAWHCGMNPLYPSDKMTEWLGEGHCSERDVLQELLNACDAKDIDVYFYIQPSEAHDFTPEEQEAVGYVDRKTQTDTYNDFINEVIAEITERYKTQLKGFWLDKGLSYGCTDTERIGETITAILPDAVLIANGYANETADFGSVEIMSVTANFEGEGYDDADDEDVETWPACERAMAFVADRHWYSYPGSIRYTSEEMYKYTVLEAGVNEEGGGVAWAIGPYPTTTISWNSGVLSGMTGLGAMIDEVGESIKGTVPSDSWPTAEGTRIQELTWGVATRSADGNYEYLHVLIAPSGTTLTIDVPDDGSEYTSAANLRTGNSCSFSQTSSQVSITLNASDSWDSVDTVIKLYRQTSAPTATSASYSVNLNEATSILLTGTDSEGSNLAFSVVDFPSHGSLSGSAPALTYTPTTDYTGTDSFTFTVNDGVYTSDLATVSILINETGAIAWTAVKNIADVNDISTNGTPVWAYSFGAAGTAAVNGVTFIGESNAVGNVDVTTDLKEAYTGYGNSIGTFSTLASEYQSILESGAYSGAANITLSGLSIGNEYELQFWLNDSRNRKDMDSTPRSATITDTSYVVDYNTAGASTNDGLGQYILGTFTAVGTTQDIELETVVPQLNAIQLRMISGSVSIGDIISGVLLDGTNMTISWTADSRVTYGIESTTNLVNGPWINVTNDIVGNDGPITVTNGITQGQQFFRIYRDE